ncbi:mitochondrial inner membrane protease subunit 2 isoform X2 [Vidua macroura]|uniref:mitochondrial inner membrane protease subunit 2 isoform X2 n=1 Tax=Vidua macroura TaxID=187451 RepID=UPI0023A7B608|nr:mitochondrial inner membrane protease subunit 2 isoform X2 [Vidua macroura]
MVVSGASLRRSAVTLTWCCCSAVINSGAPGLPGEEPVPRRAQMRAVRAAAPAAWPWEDVWSPRNPEQKIIKRVIALEGDIIKTIGYKKKYVKVPHGHIWVEGDHHGHSFDSNAFGPVSLGLLHARATHILWPPQRWQKLQPMLPPERKPLHREQE